MPPRNTQASVRGKFRWYCGSDPQLCGLVIGNVASTEHGGRVSSPRQAALQGLEKARALHEMGLKQGVIPPQERPHIPTLRTLGFCGTDSEIYASVRSVHRSCLQQ